MILHTNQTYKMTEINQPAWLQEIKALPNITEAQITRWQNLQSSIDKIRNTITEESIKGTITIDDRILSNIDQAERILKERQFSFIFFGGTGVGKSTVINAILGRDLLPSGTIGSVTGVVTIIEEAPEGEQEKLVIKYWKSHEFADRIKFLCEKAEITPFDIQIKESRDLAASEISNRLVDSDKKGEMMNERDEYLHIILECIELYKNHEKSFINETIEDYSVELNNPKDFEALKNQIWEDGIKKGRPERLIRLIKHAKFIIKPPKDNPDLFLNGNLRFIDVPGLGAGMLLHQELTETEMRSQDAMIGLVLDSNRLDKKITRECLDWIKNHHLSNLPEGEERNDAAGKIFMIANLLNEDIETYEKLQGENGIERIRNLTNKYFSKNYSDAYRNRGKKGRSFFIVMPRPALYVQAKDPKYKESAEKTLRDFQAFLPAISSPSSLDPEIPKNAESILELSEIQHLRYQISEFIRNNRIDNKLNETSAVIKRALRDLITTVESTLASKGINPPYANHLELEKGACKKNLENMVSEIKILIEKTLGKLADSKFDSNQPTVYKEVVGNIAKEITSLVDNNKTKYRNFLTGKSGAEVALRTILFEIQNKLILQIFKGMEMVAASFSDTVKYELDKSEVANKLRAVTFTKGNDYTFPVIYDTEKFFNVKDAYDLIIRHFEENFRYAVQQSTMYELVKNKDFQLEPLFIDKFTEQSGNDKLVENISSCIDSIAKNIIEYKPLSEGHKGLFLWEFDKLKDVLFTLSESIKDKIITDSSIDKELRDFIMQNSTDNFNNIDSLISLREKIIHIEKQTDLKK